MFDWSNPIASAQLIQEVGASEYNRLFAEYRKANVIDTVNGYGIEPVQTGFGRLFAVVGTDMAYQTLPQIGRAHV